MTDEATKDDAQAASWAIVELMGHRKLAGLVSEETKFGTAMLRIDVPAIGDIAAFTQYYGGTSIYAMTPCSEQVARGVAAKIQARPVQVWDLAAVTSDPQARLSFRSIDEDDEDRPF